MNNVNVKDDRTIRHPVMFVSYRTRLYKLDSPVRYYIRVITQAVNTFLAYRLTSAFVPKLTQQ